MASSSFILLRLTEETRRSSPLLTMPGNRTGPGPAAPASRCTMRGGPSPAPARSASCPLSHCARAAPSRPPAPPTTTPPPASFTFPAGAVQCLSLLRQCQSRREGRAQRVVRSAHAQAGVFASTRPPVSVKPLVLSGRRGAIAALRTLACPVPPARLSKLKSWLVVCSWWVCK